MIAAKHFDPVMGVDIHIIQPPGPVPPVPIPHPFIGNTMDVFDYVPVLGATVYVNGIPRACAGTEVKSVPHIPIGGVFVPPPPGNEGEIFMGSSTVLAEDEPMSRLGMPVLSCQSIGMMAPVRKKTKTTSMVLPVSVILSIPTGMPVLVGGPPTISMMAVGMRAGMGALGKLNKLKKSSKLMKKMSDKVHDAASKAMKKMGVPPNVQNKVHRGICSATGHPVDIATGKVFTEFVDFELPGPIPLKWERVYYSCSVLDGSLGYGWHHNYDMALAFDDDKKGMALRTPDGRGIPLPVLNQGEDFFDKKEQLFFFHDEQGYGYRDKVQLIYRFSRQGKGINKILPLTSIENKAGFAIRFKHNAHGYLSSIIDSAGRVLKVHSGPNGRIQSIHAPHPEDKNDSFPIVRYEYDAKGDLVGVYDALNHKSTFEYDNHFLIKETDRNGLSFYFEYQKIGKHIRCTRTWGDEGIYNHKLEYNLKGKYTVVTNSLGHFVAHFWNDEGIVYKEVDGDNNVTLREFGSANELLVETDPLGRRVEYAYDDRQNIISVAEPHGAVTNYTYTETDLLAGITDPNGGEWSWIYDDEGRILSRKNPAGQGASYAYNEDGLLESVQIKGGDKSILEYDEDYNLIRLVGPKQEESSWKYDHIGRCTMATGPNQKTQFREFDLNGQIRKIREPDGNKRILSYDPEGNVINATDAHHNVQFEYAAMGRLKSRIEAGTKIDFRYNTEQDLIGLQNEKQETYFFERDKAGRITKEVGFDGIIRTYIRDAAGQVNKVVRPGSKISTYEYDRGGRIVEVGHSDGSKEVFHYDLSGNLIEAINDDATVRFTRDSLGRVVEEWQNGHVVQSSYGDFGRTHIGSSLGANINIDWNTAGLVEGVQAQAKEQESWEVQFKRDAVGMELERLLPGGIRASYTRDSLGRPTAHTVSQQGEKLRAKRYIWDANDRLTQIIDDLNYGRIDFSHDSVGNLVKATYSSGEEIFRVADEVGNLFKSKDKTDRTYDKGSRLLSSREWEYHYDDEGNLTRKRHKQKGLEWRYRWLANGRLGSVLRPNQDEVSFKYDALGRRIEKTYAGRSTRWLWDGNVPLHEWQESADQPMFTIDELGDLIPHQPEGVTTWVFEEGSFVPMAKLIMNKRYSIITDYLGTPVEMYDETGQKAWSCELDIYGKVRQCEGGQGACPFRYQGQYEDVETGLYYNRFRYYSPESGTYVSQDPIGLNGNNPTLYAYVIDSNTWVDQFGLAPIGSWNEFQSATKGQFGSRKEAATGWKVYQESSQTSKQLVIGRQADTAAAALDGTGRYQRLHLEKGWTPAVNDAWVQGGIDGNKSFLMVSDPSVNRVNPPGSKFKYTVFDRELKQLEAAGYKPKGMTMNPPKCK